MSSHPRFSPQNLTVEHKAVGQSPTNYAQITDLKEALEREHYLCVLHEGRLHCQAKHTVIYASKLKHL